MVSIVVCHLFLLLVMVPVLVLLLGLMLVTRAATGERSDALSRNTIVHIPTYAP
jgi:hypothetical protein